MAASADGKVDRFYGSETRSGSGTTANYILVNHENGQYSLDYHLQAFSGIYIGMRVYGGQPIAYSGGSGASAAHLHYALTTSTNWWYTGNTLNPEGHWTTTDTATQHASTSGGRVPWLATYVTESNPGTEVLARWETKYHWVRFQNVGGRPWTRYENGGGRGSIFLASSVHAGTAQQNSPFQAADWANAWLPTWLDNSTVYPGGVGTFTFGLTANPPPGNYNDNHFNLVANGYWWFDYPTTGYYYIPIAVYNRCCAPSGR